MFCRYNLLWRNNNIFIKTINRSMSNCVLGRYQKKSQSGAIDLLKHPKSCVYYPHCYFSIQDDCDSLIEQEMDTVEEAIDQGIMDSDIFTTASLKDILYVDIEKSDLIIQQLNQCCSIDHVLEVMRENVQNFTIQQSVQCVIVLWEQFKNFEKSKHNKTYNSLTKSQEVQMLLDNIKRDSKQLTPDELTVSFLYLSKLEVDMHNPTMYTILEECLQMIRNGESVLPLTALSRFTVTVNSSKQLYTFFVCKEAYPLILNYLKNAKNSEDLRLVTISLNNLHQLVSKHVLQMYQDKVWEFYENGKLNSETTRCLLKVIQFLNYPHWSQQNATLIRTLILTLKDKIHSFQIKELELLVKIFQSQLEPAEITPYITKQAQTLFDKTPTAELLACTVMYALPEQRLKMTKIAQNFINSDIDSTTIPTLFKVLRLLKTSNINICDRYWSKVSNEIRENSSERESYILARHFHRYMYFNNNLGGTYRHFEFEKLITKLLIEDLQQGISLFIPSKFARIASFLLAYGHTPKSKYIFPELIVHKIEDMNKQFSILDCLHISRGIQIAMEMRYKNQISPQLASQLLRIENVMNANAKRHLEMQDINLNQLNSVIRACNNRKISRMTSLYDQILNKYSTIKYSLSSRLLKDITFNLKSSKFIIPTICEDVMDYTVKNKIYVLGDTVEKVLHCLYNLGYVPKNKDILTCSAEIVLRDFNYMTGLSIVQVCLALAFYKALPECLINKVFNIEFIKRLEEEIHMCYSKATYPQKVLFQVMQLNRAVCLDYPEAGVPWFQQNYIEAQMSKLPIVKDKFNSEIQDMLLTFISDKSLLKLDHVTPYGYTIDFVVYFDKNNNIVPVPKTDAVTSTINKVAILLMKIDAFCQNDNNFLRGQEHLKERHLEILGYKVIQIKYNEWHSMFMNVPGAKVNYLKNLLQIV